MKKFNKTLYECPICKIKTTKLNYKHVVKCFSNEPYYIFKFYSHNFPIMLDKNAIEDVYINQKLSTDRSAKLLNLPNGGFIDMSLHYHGIKKRSISESHKTESYKTKIENTNLERLGAINPLSKNTEPWIKRNKTVLDKYGVENVWQCIDDFTSEYGNKSKLSSLNKRIFEILENAKIDYRREFRIKYKDDENKTKWKFYDLKINNTLIEINGDYWHANPNKYKAEHVFNFPKTVITAQDIWNMDKFKRELAELYNFKFCIIWEDEMKKMTNDELLQHIKNQIN